MKPDKFANNAFHNPPVNVPVAESGLGRIQQAFLQAQAAGRAALMPYFTIGYPTQDQSENILAAIAAAGADLIELGIPFSDPLADGPTIQQSTQVALEQGITPAACLEVVAGLRQRGVTQPLLLMGYINPLLTYGVENFVHQAQIAGADGLIVPDLPPEEAADLLAACQKYRLALVFLAAPNSSPERLAKLANQTSGFLYLVSLTGVTGARERLPQDLNTFIQRARKVARTPLVVGFGISSPLQARQVGALADGVIVGSALIRVVAQADQPEQAAAAFVAALREGLNRQD